MKAESAGPVAADQPPDEHTAAAAKAKATRIAESAIGLSLFAAALVVAAIFVLLYTLGDRSAPYYFPAWLGVLLGLGAVHWPLFFWIQRRRARAGLPLVEAKRPSAARIALLTAALAAWILAACLVIMHLGDFEAYRLAIIVPFGVGYGVLCGIHGIGARQWEDVLQGIALCAFSGLVALSPRFPPEVWLILFAVSFVLSGLVKHLRWRRWVWSLPDRRAEAAPEGGAAMMAFPSSTAGDLPPDPAAAAAAVREARRRLAASRGLARALVGLLALVAFAIVWAGMTYRTEVHINTIILLVIALVAMEVLLPLIISRLRRSRGGAAAGYLEGETERLMSRTSTLALLAFAGAAAVLAIAAAMVVLQQRKVSSEWLAGFDTAVILGCTTVVVAALGVRYRRLGLGEDLLMAGAVAAAGLLLAWARDSVRLEPIAMIIAGAAVVSGVALHVRWRRWSRSPLSDHADGSGKEATP